MGKSVPFKARLIWIFLAVGCLPQVFSAIASNQMMRAELTTSGQKILETAGHQHRNEVRDFVGRIGDMLMDLAASESTPRAIRDLSGGLDDFQKRTLSLDEKKVLSDFYVNEFGRAYAEKNPESTLDGRSLFAKLDHVALVGQFDFIAANEHPLGKKDKAFTSKSGGSYSEAHARYHESLHSYLDHYGLYDLFLIRADGRMVYSVYKETDFATSLVTGPWKDTGLARAFEASKKLKKGEIHMDDYAAYAPSYEAPASFLSTPVFEGDRYVGTVVVQIPIDRINQLVLNRDGLGQKGETLLLGSDAKLRADSFRNKGTYSVEASFKEGSKLTISSEALRLAQKGSEGVVEQVSYDGLPTWTYYTPIKVFNQTWYMTSDISRDEMLAGVSRLNWVQVFIGVIGVLIVAGVAWYTGSSVSRRLQHMIDELNESSRGVSSASRATAQTSTELSEAATEQAASLQETMASIEEISAMVNQNAESAGKVMSVVDTNQQATQEGSRSVSEMLQAIEEIKVTNDQILTQMETGNKEFAEIVRIISEIGEKTKVINDIVFQTKLLSFNASVEAARAGEHGKGFSVVASEVGSLAEMSGSAAQQISSMLAESIKKVNEIVDQTTKRVDRLVEVGKDKISIGQVTAQKCREALDRIAENAGTVTSMVTEIAHASKEQAEGVKEINKAISQLDQVTQKNSAMAQQSSSQAQRLNGESATLQDVIHELVDFVNGEGRRPKEDPNLPSEQVIHLNTAAKKAVAVKSAPVLKKAAGDDVVPSHDDPQFEEI